MSEEWQKMTEEEVKTMQPSIPSLDACKAWDDLLNELFNTTPDLQQVIIPTVSYIPGKHSDDGARLYVEPLTLIRCPDNEHDDYAIRRHVQKCISLTPVGHEIALNCNVMLVEFAKPPRSVKLDIIDVGVEFNDIVHLHKHNYNILKTTNSYHMYAKVRVDSIVVNGGYIIKDDKWQTGFIRVTDSEAKGAITAV